MKQTYVLEVDGKPKMVFREKDDAAAANWIKGAAIWVEGNPGWHGTMTTRQATIPEQAAWRAHSVEMAEYPSDDPDIHVLVLDAYWMAVRGQEGPLATPLVTSLAAAISTDPLRETRSLDAVAGFLPVKRWVKKSPDGTTGLVSNMASCPMAGPDPKEPRKWPSLGRSP
jgi:hypothetical protein